MKAWALDVNGKLWPDCFRNRRRVQIYAARRLMGADEFTRIVGERRLGEWSDSSGNWPTIKALWAAVKKRHPTARLARVEVRRT